MKLRNEIDEHNWKRYLVSSIEDINDTLLETNRILEKLSERLDYL
mgnify:CR=1 FL=1